MNMKKICVAVALAAVMTFAVSAAQAADMAPAATTTTTTAATTTTTPAVEKCYGVAKAGKDVAVELPAGVCEKLVNGTLTAPVK